MKVLHINGYLRKDLFYYHLYRELEAQGIQQRVVAPSPRGYVQKAAQVPPYCAFPPCFREAERYVFPLKQRHMYQAVCENAGDINSYDIIHAHTVFSDGYSAYRLHLKYNIPYIVAVRSSDIHAFLKKMPVLRPLGREILSHAKAIIFISNAYRDHALRPYLNEAQMNEVLKKSEVIPNGLDPFWLSTPPASKPDKEGKPWIVLTPALINVRKNLPLVARACELLNQQGLNIVYHVVGKVVDEKEEKKLRAFACVTIYPFCNKERLIDYYAESDVMAMVSRSETFGLTYTEAMSRGLPVVYTKGEGFDGTYPEGEVGFRADKTSAADVAAQIKNAIEHADEIRPRAIQNARAYAWPDIAARYVSLYQSIQK